MTLATFLRERLSQVDWAFSSSSFTLEALHTTPLKAIPPFSRLAILRWIIDSEPDVHFRLRPHFTRSSPCQLWMWQIFFAISIWVPIWLCPPLPLLFSPHLDFACLSLLVLFILPLSPGPAPSSPFLYFPSCLVYPPWS